MTVRTTIPLVLLAVFATGQEPAKDLRPKPVQAASPTTPDAELEARMTPEVRAVQRAADSVVSIYIGHANRLAKDGFEADGQGSGVILDESGLVITNWHVVAPVERSEQFKVQVRLRNSKAYAAALLSTSPEWDLALLQLTLPPGDKVKPIALGDSDTLMIAETVLAIGNPQGNANTVSRGILSATARTILVRAPDGQARRYSGLLQTDAAINPGNSGGALIDITGKLIGINNAMAQGAENIGFAIPVNTMKKVFESVLLSSENLASVWLGFTVKDQEGRPMVAEVHPQGPAARAGLRAGDLLRAAGGERIGTALDFARRALQARAGEPMPLLVHRRGADLRLETTPLSKVDYAFVRLIGAEVEEVGREGDQDYLRRVTKAFYEHQGYTRYQLLPVALRVKRVHADGPAHELGLKPGDAIVAMPVPDFFGRSRRYAFGSAEDLIDKLRGRDLVQIEVVRENDLLEGKLAIRR